MSTRTLPTTGHTLGTTPGTTPGQTVGRLGLGAFLIGAGALHFANPAFFRPLVPPILPTDLTVYASGIAELAVGAALLPQRWQKPAGYAAAALFVGVLPGNVYAAVAGIETVAGQPAWANWARLPLQLPLIALSLWLARSAPSAPPFRELVRRDAGRDTDG